MLHACPKCQRTFPADMAAFCPEDATRLVPIQSLPVPRDPADPIVGHALAGEYEIRRIVADGAMGRVYEARQIGTEKRVAVKILHANVANDPVNIERFRREAETSHSLDHRYVIDVYHFDEAAGVPGRKDKAWYLVMEYLDGDELRNVLKRLGTLPVARIVRVMSQAAVGLDTAHQRGIVHRDLKPDNLFLVRTHDGDEVKVLDFGSVKFTKGQDRGHKLTVMGTTIGSPFYMSPEQARGLPDLDARADVWALGAMVYEMAVGKVPFYAAIGPQVLFKIIGEEPMPPSFANDAAPPQLDDFMIKALCKKREGRYQSCGELADALGHVFGLQGTHHDWATASENDLATQLGSSSSRAPAPASHRPPAATDVPARALVGRAPLDSAPVRPLVPRASRPPVSRLSSTDPGDSEDASRLIGPPIGLYVGGAIGVLLVVAALVMVALR